MIDEVRRSGNEVEVVVRMEGGMERRVEERRRVGMDIDRIVIEIVDEINSMRDDGEELVRLVSCSKMLNMREKRSDVWIKAELTQLTRELPKPKVKKLFELGVKRFLKKPPIDPKDYLRG